MQPSRPDGGGAPDGPRAPERLRELYARLDAFFERVLGRRRASMECRPGCTDCCRRFSVTGVEAALLREAAAALPPAARAAIARRAATAEEACPALEADGRCAVYAARPAICRTHGLPIRFVEPDADRRRLPLVSACEKNFRDEDLAALPSEDVLDQATVSTVLAALDAAHAAQTGASGRRVSITDALG